MRRALGCALFLVGLACLTPSSGAAAPPDCRDRQLVVELPLTSAPSQAWSVGVTVGNGGGRTCRLALPVSLRLTHRSGAPLRVEPRTSRLTLVARALRPQARASVTWTYENYCGARGSSRRPIAFTVRVGGTELTGTGGTPPCNVPRKPVLLRVLFACPSARGPAIEAILPRRLPLCLR